METALQSHKKRKINWKKVSIWTLSIIVVLILVGYFAASAYISRSLPKTEGKIKLSGLNAKVNVIRDKNGVPHIDAENEQDLYMAQGYIQAQDRLFQMDLSRRQASGELSEVVGEAAIDKDKYFRTLGLRRAATASYNEYSSQAKETLQWFADGVNAYIKELKDNGKWPIEFTILGYKPKEWTPIDSLTIGKYMAFDLGGHWEDQAFRYYLLQNFPKEKAYDLFPSYPKDAPYIISKDTLNLEKSFASAVIPPEFNGSNDWVVSGKKTKSGKPILADDPHLGLNSPSIWYQMQLKAPTVNVSGVIFAGVPGIILGHNEEIAWGVTNTGPDVQDLYIEKRNPKEKNQFLYNKKWENAEVIKEPIKVKDRKTIDYEVTITRHGPVISEFAADSGKDTVLSLQWTALQPSNELEAVLQMNKAGNWDEFEKALENFETPTQNFVFASKDGTIAYKANGKIPIRKKGDGLLPVPGWTDEYEWTGYIPFNELPKTVNPKEGFISTANNKVISDDYPYHISHNWAQPYRQMRIQEVLKSKDQITAKDMQDLQMDKVNLQAKEFVPIFLDHLKEIKDKSAKEALTSLQQWNYIDDKDAAAPLIFNMWMRKIPEVLFAKEISKEMLDKFGGQKQAVDELIRHAAEGQPGPWITEHGGLQKVLQSSLTLAIKEIEKTQGDNVKKWEWGKYHQLYFGHPLSSVKPLNYLFNSDGKVPVGGSSVTVQAAANKEDGTVDHGASWRFVIDTSDMNTGYHIVGPGQSGHIKSEWYHDQLKAWTEGTYHETKLNTQKGTKLVLSP
ncbi:penicillin acylase family protein [Heyndrickxia sporothermodurans]|uniref:penicillin acylase family protein n=1 Tax=Heyndrickxia sporothermodurans TaxID=46224 RepID=UPI002DBC3114|nr:penicillin acylase family protein [Heyndrickxia sporothermodurans]MEB6549973.1 penicillin acylase family protein [Heyndrickxia sporothermodurans]MED3653886.1 penicillin acylase family protein [Heyndrickxia sporothermodurans]MED3779899.1 penicillin acylase family protein [Heyndrickxia sporothermodurans]